jgi:hypothetical protein
LAQWVIVSFGLFFELPSPHFWPTLHIQRLILAKKVLGYILGVFFTNSSSGHPALDAHKKFVLIMIELIRPLWHN